MQWVLEKAPGKQDLSLFTVGTLTWAGLQSGSAVGDGKYVWQAGFVAIYGGPAHLGRSPEWICSRCLTMPLATRICRYLRCARSLRPVPRVDLQFIFEDAPGNQASLLLTVSLLSLVRLCHVSVCEI